MSKELKLAILFFAIFLVIENLFIIHLMSGKKKPPVSKPPVTRGITKKPPVQPVPYQGSIAIVLDDWGYNLNALPLLEEIKYPVTISVLPYLAYSRTVAEEAHRRGFELILHLPLEPFEKFRLENDTIMTTMNEAEITAIVKKDLEDIAYARGANNHMGSKGTTNKKTMGVIFKELKKRNLYFLDSFVSSDSICSEEAQKADILFAKRDIFLDNKSDPGYIKTQLFKLKAKAKMYGKAIGIGHDRKNTLQVLKETMPELEKEGYRFVFVSQLLERKTQ